MRVLFQKKYDVCQQFFMQKIFKIFKIKKIKKIKKSFEKFFERNSLSRT